MTAHLTARLAWHDDGWNGRVCRRPACNTYCVGAYSFPGDIISRERDLALEEQLAGEAVSGLSGSDLPPCVYSVNAFGSMGITGYSNPPEFFYGGAQRAEWEIPAATVCVWPYEAMYGDAVRTERGWFDNDKRSAKAEEFFEEIDSGRSLIFYYANYSNPFSEEELPRYVLIGASRVKSVGERLVYAEVNDRVQERYAGGMIWARNVSTHYPHEGLRLPYHAYREDPEAMSRIGVFPENPRTCKYGSRLVKDDEAIGLLEQLLVLVRKSGIPGRDAAGKRPRIISKSAPPSKKNDPASPGTPQSRPAGLVSPDFPRPRGRRAREGAGCSNRPAAMAGGGVRPAWDASERGGSGCGRTPPIGRRP